MSSFQLTYINLYFSKIFEYFLQLQKKKSTNFMSKHTNETRNRCVINDNLLYQTIPLDSCERDNKRQVETYHICFIKTAILSLVSISKRLSRISSQSFRQEKMALTCWRGGVANDMVSLSMNSLIPDNIQENVDLTLENWSL